MSTSNSLPESTSNLVELEQKKTNLTLQKTKLL